MSMSSPIRRKQKQFTEDMKFAFRLITRLLIFRTDLAQTRTHVYTFSETCSIARYYMYKSYNACVAHVWLKKNRAR